MIGRPIRALACGYVPGEAITPSQLSRRWDKKGIGPYFLTFYTLVAILIRLILALGLDWAIDSIIVYAYSRREYGTDSSFRQRISYKVPMLIYCPSLLPMMFRL